MIRIIKNLINKVHAARAPKLATVAEVTGLDPIEDRGLLVRIGIQATKLHVARYGVKPLQVPAVTPEGRAIKVAGYSPTDRTLITRAWLIATA
jgi:hypothetical protein